MKVLLSVLGIALVVLAIAGFQYPDLRGGALGAGIAATISVAVLWTNRRQEKRNTTLELFKEYYTADFAKDRRSAASFMKKHVGVDWSKEDPYVLGEKDDDLAGYGTVIRYWQRVAILYMEGEADRRLAGRLLARELGEWKVRILDPMSVRKGMYARDDIMKLVKPFSEGKGKEAFEEGTKRAASAYPREHAGRPRAS